MALSPKHRQALMSVIPAATAGTVAAVQSQQDNDPIGSTLLKTALAGTGGALAGRYLPALMNQGLRDLGGKAVDAVKGLEGKGILSAAVGLPVAGLAGGAAYQVGRAINAPLDAAGVPGFQNNQSYGADQAMNYLQQSLAAEAAMMQPMAINPEAYGLSSNTDSARMGMY